MKMAFLGTEAPWSIPHLSDETAKCNCTAVLCEGYCGAIANIHFSKDGDDWREGDNPPLHEAIYNGKLIGMSPELLRAAINLIEIFEEEHLLNFDNSWSAAQAFYDLKEITHKALGIYE